MPTAVFAAFLADESGATAIEYGLLAAMIAVVIIGTVVALGNSMVGLYNNATVNTLDAQTDILAGG